jgi:hypothetical protein
MNNEEMLTTTDHTIIHEWARTKHGVPVLVNTRTITPNKDKIAIAFGGLWQNTNVEHISWHEWFSVFEEEHLVFKFHKSEAIYELAVRDKAQGVRYKAHGFHS